MTKPSPAPIRLPHPGPRRVPRAAPISEPKRAMVQKGAAREVRSATRAIPRVDNSTKLVLIPEKSG